MFDENGNIRLEYLRSRQSNKVDREILEDWVETPLNNLVREARRRIVDNLRHVSQDDFETKLKQMTEALNSLIGRMAGDSSYAVAFGSQYNKSNRWVYELARRDLAKKPADVLYTHDIRKDRILDNASCVVYFDDMSASGQQLEQNLSMINRLDKRYIIAIPYISTRALEKIGELKKQGYTIELVPGYEVMKTVGEVLKDMDKYVLGLKDGHPDLMTSLYYFDHRIPDSKSFFLSEMFANKRIKETGHIEDPAVTALGRKPFSLRLLRLAVKIKKGKELWK
jgi:hypothetical protein